MADPKRGSRRYKDVKELSAHLSAEIKAEARVVRTALRCNRLGAEHPGFWPAYFAMENACAALERIRKGGKKR